MKLFRLYFIVAEAFYITFLYLKVKELGFRDGLVNPDSLMIIILLLFLIVVAKELKNSK